MCEDSVGEALAFLLPAVELLEKLVEAQCEEGISESLIRLNF